jgi:G3E family GTPase
LKLRQISFADLVLLNKTDLVTPQHVEVVRDWIDAHIKRIRVVEAIHGDAPLEILLGVGRFTEAQLPDDERVHEHASDAFDRWHYSSDKPFDRDALERMVKRRLPGNVYRCKGIVSTGDDPGHLYVLQVVGRRTDLAPATHLPGDVGTTSEIIAIGRGLDPVELDALFSGCHVDRPR